METETIRCKCGTELLMNYDGETLKFQCSSCDFKHEVKIPLEAIKEDESYIDGGLKLN